MSAITKSQDDAIHNAFGQHAEDVILPIKSASDVCDWLEELFKAIAKEAEKKSPDQSRLMRLADMGAYLAMDFGNLYDHQHEEMYKALKKAGQIPAAAVRRPEWSAHGLG